MIDVDGSPSGYVAWYNHYTETSRIRIIRPAVKNDKFGVQRMEMLAIYFALADNCLKFRKMSKSVDKKKKQQQQQQLIIDIRSDSKSTVEQLQGISEIRDIMLQRICGAIQKLLVGMTYYTILFNHLERTRNIAGLLLEQRRRKEKEQFIILDRVSNITRYRGGGGGLSRFGPIGLHTRQIDIHMKAFSFRSDIVPCITSINADAMLKISS